MTLKVSISLCTNFALSSLLLLVTTVSGQAQVQYPSDMPSTPYPDIKGCSSSQEAYLKQAWRLAHYYTWRADKLVDHIQSQDKNRRDDLWSRDYIAGSNTSPSPRRWFGSYDNKRAGKVQDAIDKARKRFEQKGSIVKGIRVLRCGQPILPSQDEHTDVCPAGNPGSNGPPGGYHFPVGTIVTCPSFWDRANDRDNGSLDVRLSKSARPLVHEIFHWLSVDGKYVTDIHGGQKYYGFDRATLLAEEKPNWAIYNNDNYAWFIYNLGRYEPTFSGIWGEKEGFGIGGMFLSKLVDQRDDLKAEPTLLDMEEYTALPERIK